MIEDMEHGHSEHSHAHSHAHAPLDYGWAFAIGITLNLLYVIGEAIAGIVSGSLALIADAGHNLSDVLSLSLAWGAAVLSRRQPSGRFTYGLRSSSILAALANAIILLVVTGGIAWEALRRIGDPITLFPATHLGADHLLVSFAEIDDTVVKIDVEIVTSFEFRRPQELIALYDPDNLVPQVRQRVPVSFDIELANRRVAGWLWYAYSKAARGEVFEAIDALDGIRKLALVPLLIHRAGAKIEGYRRLERKLDSATIAPCRSR